MKYTFFTPMGYVKVTWTSMARGTKMSYRGTWGPLTSYRDMSPVFTNKEELELWPSRPTVMWAVPLKAWWLGGKFRMIMLGTMGLPMPGIMVGDPHSTVPLRAPGRACCNAKYRPSTMQSTHATTSTSSTTPMRT